MYKCYKLGQCTLVLHRQSKTHNVENIRVYSPRIARSKIQGQPQAHAPAQLILSTGVTED